MAWFSRRTVQEPPLTQISLQERTERKTREEVEKQLMDYCRKIGLLEKDVQHILKNYRGGGKKRWKNMKMSTIYKDLNDKNTLPFVVFLDTRMTEEEMEEIDKMSFGDLQVYCQYENPTRLTQFFHEAKGESLTRAELAERAKYDLRLTYEEIRAKETLIDMSRYWCKVRPEVWSRYTRADLMRLFKE